MFLRSVHIVAWIIIPFPGQKEWLDHILFVLQQLVDIGVVSTFLSITIMLLWTSMHKLLCGYVFPNLLAIHVGVELLGHVVTVFKFLRNCQSFHSGYIILHSHQPCMRVIISPHACLHFYHLPFLLQPPWWVGTGISPWFWFHYWVMMASLFPRAHRPFACLLWRNINSNPLFTFQMGYLLCCCWVVRGFLN